MRIRPEGLRVKGGMGWGSMQHICHGARIFGKLQIEDEQRYAGERAHDTGKVWVGAPNIKSFSGWLNHRLQATVGQWARLHESCRDRIKDTICAFSTIHSRTAVTGCVPIPQILKMKSEAIFAELQVDLSP